MWKLEICHQVWGVPGIPGFILIVAILKNKEGSLRFKSEQALPLLNFKFKFNE